MPRPRLRPTRRPFLASACFAFALLLAAAPTPASASMGDRAPAYQRCTAACEAIRCHPGDSTPKTTTDAAPPDWDDYPVRSLFWPCGDTCRYICQHYLTDLALSATDTAPEGLPAGRQVQFHGKWPFHRLDLSGLPWFPFLPLKILTAILLPKLQEPLSVLFSFGNLYAHYRGLQTLRNLSHRGRMTEGKRLARVYEVYAWSGIVAWIASVVFHARDVDWTERADYFAAAGTMLVGLWAGVVRVKGWYSPAAHGRVERAKPNNPRHRRQRRAAPVAWTLAVAAVFVLHCSYLGSRDRFDYTYNMQFNVLVALSTIALWTAWSYRQSRLPNPSNFSRRQLSSYPSARARFRAPHYLSPLLPLILLPLLTTLELLDFAPVGFGTNLRLLDAHALWHLSTIPVVWMWYRFLIKDVRWIDGQGEGGDPNSVLPAAPGSAASSLGGLNGATTTTAAAAGNDTGGGGGGSSWVLERLEREGRKLGYALGGGGRGGGGGDHHPVASSSSAATGSDAATNVAVRRESSSGGGGGGAGSTGAGASSAGKVKAKVKGID